MNSKPKNAALCANTRTNVTAMSRLVGKNVSVVNVALGMAESFRARMAPVRRAGRVPQSSRNPATEMIVSRVALDIAI